MPREPHPSVPKQALAPGAGRSELVDLWFSHNESHDPSRTVVKSEYLEVVGVRA